LNWKLLFHVFFCFSYGVALHDYMHQVWELKGTVFSLEGGYVGFIGMVVAWILLSYKDILTVYTKIKYRGAEKGNGE